MLKPIMLLVICTNITPSEAEVRLPTWRGSLLENGRTRNPFNLRSVLVHGVVHIPGDPQCSAEERYNNNQHHFSILREFLVWVVTILRKA